MSDLLQKVKDGLQISGNQLDATLTIYIDEVKEYLKSAGVSQSIIDSDKSLGVIVRGVADLWTYGSAEARFSEYFYQRVIQLRGAKDETI